MALVIQTQPSRLFTRDIAAFSDAELDQYLETNGRSIKVEDPENLKKDEVLLQRLRARAGGAQSHPIDLNDLTARLNHISAKRDSQAPLRPPSQTGSDFRSRETTDSIDDEEWYRHCLRRETRFYNILINEGGRPSHPVNLGRDILEDPEYRDILRFWSRSTNEWQVFQSQMCEWRDFRKYQRINREEGRFPVYVDAVKRSFTRHGFTRPFQLDEDLERQDKVTTWIEYLDYEYWEQDKIMKFVKRLQPKYDEAWKELVDSQVLGPSETEEFILDIKSAFQHASEEERAEKEVHSAKLAVVSAQKATRQVLEAAQSQLAAALRSLESIKRRNDLISKFHSKAQNYKRAKGDAERLSILLRWIVQQIPLIELELSQAKAAENGSGGEDGSNPADHLNQERVSKHRREDGGNDALPKHRSRACTAPMISQDSSSTQRPPQTAGQEGQLKRNFHVATEEGRPDKRRRYSGQTSNTAEPEPLSIHSDKPELDAAQAPKPRKRQAKVYKKVRESRRIAGQPPEFGMLPKRNAPAPPYEAPSRYPSNTRKANPSGPHSQASSKKKSSAKPQGILKRSKRSKK